MDRRQQRTRDAIFEAFGALLAQKSFSQITVQDIIDRANIGRTTFYAHFSTKNELLEALCSDIFNHVFSDSLQKEITHDFSQSKQNPHSIITHIIYHLLENNRNILNILTFEQGALFYAFFKQFFSEFASARLLQGLGSRTQAAGGHGAGPEQTLPQDFVINHISSSFIGMIQWWLDNNRQYSPEQLATFFLQVISPLFDPDRAPCRA